MRTALMALLVATAVLLAACEREGPAERAGEKVDEAVDDLKDAVDDE